MKMTLALNNTEELIAHLLLIGDDETKKKILAGILFPKNCRENSKLKCTLDTLRFILSVLPEQVDKKVFIYSEETRSRKSKKILLKLPDWLSEESFYIGIADYPELDIFRIIELLGYKKHNDSQCLRDPIVDDESGTDDGGDYKYTFYLVKA